MEKPWSITPSPLWTGPWSRAMWCSPCARLRRPARRPPRSPPAQAYSAQVRTAPESVRPLRPREVHLFLNGDPLVLPAKEDGSPYYLMDLLEYSGIDFEHLDRAVRLEVNGVERGFQHTLKEQDSVTITLN